MLKRLKIMLPIGVIIVIIFIIILKKGGIPLLDKINIPINNEGISAHLKIDNNMKNVNISTPNSQPYYTVSLTPYKKDFILCSYQEIFRLNDKKMVRLTPPDGVSNWNPTGVFFDKNSNILHVANYNGHNILQLRIDEENNSLKLIKEINNLFFKSPENIAAFNGKIAVADYDANKVFLFGNDGDLIWNTEIKQAHGIAIDENYVYATSLIDRTILKLDNKTGNIINKIGSVGWDKNQYLWPTSLSISDKYLLVTDAHSGKISILNKDLQFIASYGGNGPGIDLFNFPYTSIFYKNQILVLDSFKSRLVKLDMKGKLKEQLNFGNKEIKGSQLDLITGGNKNPYTFISKNIEDIPASFFNPFFMENAKLVYGFNSIDVVKNNITLAQYEIDIPNSKSLTGGYYWYVTWMKRISLDNNDYYIFGSPQHHSFIIYDLENNLFYVHESKEILYDIWPINDQISSAGLEKIDFATIINNEFKPKINNYLENFKNGHTKLKAFHLAFYSKLTDDEFNKMLDEMMITEYGKIFLDKLKEGKITNIESTEYYIKTISEPIQYLFENLFIKSFGEGIKKETEISTDAKIVTEEIPYEGYGIKESIDDDPNTYTSFMENKNPGKFTLEWEKLVKVDLISVEWLLKEDIGDDFSIIGIDQNNNEHELVSVKNNSQIKNEYIINSNKRFKKITFIFNKGEGQNRLLLRNYKIFGNYASEN